MISARHWIQTGSGVDKWDSGFHRLTTAERPDAAVFWAARTSPHFREPFKPRIAVYFLSFNIYLLNHSFFFKSTFLNLSLILVSFSPFPTLPFPYAVLYFLRSFLLIYGGWSSWLRHCATSWKVASSIPDGVGGIFHWYNPSGSEVDSASNRNEYQEYFLGGKGGRCVRLTTLSPSCADCLEIWEPRPPGTLRTCPGLYWDCLIFLRSYLCSSFSHAYSSHHSFCGCLPFRNLFCFSLLFLFFAYCFSRVINFCLLLVLFLIRHESCKTSHKRSFRHLSLRLSHLHHMQAKSNFIITGAPKGRGGGVPGSLPPPKKNKTFKQYTNVVHTIPNIVRDPNRLMTSTLEFLKMHLKN